jgi:nucleoside-diphosphate-sugar epimerase|tara:strand:+ start:25 stop:726 length:702 start_codon:yes stop_codon:yes gene_type:complete
MKILVTGHKGFIGSYLFNHLKKVGHEVDGIDFPDDIVDFKGGDYDVIVHLAAFAALRDSLKNPDKFWENNVIKSKPIFEYCKEKDIRLLYASSAGAHSWWQNPYAITKKVNEIQAPPNSVGMRFFNVWAEEGSRKDMLYRMLKENTAPYLTKHRRDWIHVHDVARAICYLIPDNFRGVLDIGTGKNNSVLELAMMLGRSNLPIKEVQGEPESLCADTTQLTNLGWRPTIDIIN